MILKGKKGGVQDNAHAAELRTNAFVLHVVGEIATESENAAQAVSVRPDGKPALLVEVDVDRAMLQGHLLKDQIARIQADLLTGGL